MIKRARRDVATFKRVQQGSGRYHISPYSVQEQAIREHVARGFVDPRRRLALAEMSLLDQANKI